MDSEKLIKQMEENVRKVKSGKINPAFKDLPEFAVDPTNPLTPIAGQLAEDLTGILPNPSSSNTRSKSIQSRKEIKEIAIKTSSSTGVIVEEIHIEDLLLIANSTGEALTYRDIYLYMRGVAKANQISMTTTLSKIITNVESMLSKNQQTMQKNIDSNKLVSEKISVVGTKIDNIIPTLSSTISDEHASTRDLIRAHADAGSQTRPSISHQEISSSSNPPKYPNGKDIFNMCIQMGCPENFALNYGNKFEGVISWEEYKTVMSGAVSVETFKSYMPRWKKMRDERV
ncbi:TPA_asm: P [Fraxinus gammacytorhabdovirus 2]|nr:TPA_asm: P [Fraxinus gammacytorhabdovirus 2]